LRGKAENIGTEHLARCGADDHHVRPGLDPMLVRVPFGMCADLAKDIVAGLTGNSPDKNFTLW
jgi:hypothetical protein